VAGLGANTVGGVVGAHLGRTLDAGRERIAILGARDSGTASAAPNVITDAALGSDRVAVVAPGIRTTDLDGASIVLPPSALAAVVAGRLSTLAPHVSLTNKVLPLDGLDVNYSSALLQNLLQSHVLLVRRKFGFQVVKAITTDPGPFTQISVRRTVDFAKAGVRSGADPYIGRLNNARVRAALQATLDGFLSQMVLDEMLTGYALEVTATRDQEIRGVCQVIMTLKPTFSIDFIRVTMNLE
jgi:phage tail sheath protein FI